MNKMNKSAKINYNELLKIGQEKEGEAQKLIKNIDKVEIIEVNNDFKFDFKTSNNKTYEVKYDRKAPKTGNIFIEFKTTKENNDELYSFGSGIRTTTAHYYIIVIILNELHIFFIIDTDELKLLIKNNNFDKRYCPNIEKGSYSYGYIIPISIIQTISKIYMKNNDSYYLTSELKI
jgi:hypothetical protein